MAVDEAESPVVARQVKAKLEEVKAAAQKTKSNSACVVEQARMLAPFILKVAAEARSTVGHLCMDQDEVVSLYVDCDVPSVTLHSVCCSLPAWICLSAERTELYAHLLSVSQVLNSLLWPKVLSALDQTQTTELHETCTLLLSPNVLKQIVSECAWNEWISVLPDIVSLVHELKQSTFSTGAVVSNPTLVNTSEQGLKELHSSQKKDKKKKKKKEKPAVPRGLGGKFLDMFSVMKHDTEDTSTSGRELDIDTKQCDVANEQLSLSPTSSARSNESMTVLPGDWFVRPYLDDTRRCAELSKSVIEFAHWHTPFMVSHACVQVLQFSTIKGNSVWDPEAFAHVASLVQDLPHLLEPYPVIDCVVRHFDQFHEFIENRVPRSAMIILECLIKRVSLQQLDQLLQTFFAQRAHYFPGGSSKPMKYGNGIKTMVQERMYMDTKRTMMPVSHYTGGLLRSGCVRAVIEHLTLMAILDVKETMQMLFISAYVGLSQYNELLWQAARALPSLRLSVESMNVRSHSTKVLVPMPLAVFDFQFMSDVGAVRVGAAYADQIREYRTTLVNMCKPLSEQSDEPFVEPQALLLMSLMQVSEETLNRQSHMPRLLAHALDIVLACDAAATRIDWAIAPTDMDLLVAELVSLVPEQSKSTQGVLTDVTHINRLIGESSVHGPSVAHVLLSVLMPRMKSVLEQTALYSALCRLGQLQSKRWSTEDSEKLVDDLMRVKQGVLGGDMAKLHVLHSFIVPVGCDQMKDVVRKLAGGLLNMESFPLSAVNTSGSVLEWSTGLEAFSTCGLPVHSAGNAECTASCSVYQLLKLHTAAPKTPVDSTFNQWIRDRLSALWKSDEKAFRLAMGALLLSTDPHTFPLTDTKLSFRRLIMEVPFNISGSLDSGVDDWSVCKAYADEWLGRAQLMVQTVALALTMLPIEYDEQTKQTLFTGVGHTYDIQPTTTGLSWLKKSYVQGAKVLLPFAVESALAVLQLEKEHNKYALSKIPAHKMQKAAPLYEDVLNTLESTQRDLGCRMDSIHIQTDAVRTKCAHIQTDKDTADCAHGEATHKPLPARSEQQTNKGEQSAGADCTTPGTNTGWGSASGSTTSTTLSASATGYTPSTHTIKTHDRGGFSTKPALVANSLCQDCGYALTKYTCFHCKKKCGYCFDYHRGKDCPKITCRNCGGLGHMGRECPAPYRNQKPMQPAVSSHANEPVVHSRQTQSNGQHRDRVDSVGKRATTDTAHNSWPGMLSGTGTTCTTSARPDSHFVQPLPARPPTQSTLPASLMNVSADELDTVVVFDKQEHQLEDDQHTVAAPTSARGSNSQAVYEKLCQPVCRENGNSGTDSILVHLGTDTSRPPPISPVSVANTVLSAIPMGHMSCGGVGRGSPVTRTVGLTQPRLNTVYQHHDVSMPPPATHPMTSCMPPSAVHYQDSTGPCPPYVPSASVHSNALLMLDQRTQEHSAKLKAEESEQHGRDIMNIVVPAMHVPDAVLGLQQHSHGHVYTNTAINVGPYQGTGTFHNNRDRDQHNNRAERTTAASGVIKNARSARRWQAGQVLWASDTAGGDGDTNKPAEHQPEKPSSAADTDKNWRSSASTSRVFNNSSVSSGEHNRRQHANAGPGAHRQGHMNMTEQRDSARRMRNGQCHQCSEIGHLKRDCPNPQKKL